MKRVQLFVLVFIALLVLPAVAGAQGLKSSGIISSSRATDWTQAGAVPGSTGSLPDASWTQCGSTLSAGTSAATITSDLAACPANTYLMLGPGTFNLSGQIRFPTTGHVALRGSGANSTFLIIGASGGTGCQNGSAGICVSSSDQPYFNEPPPNMCAWTSGYSQGATSITLSAAGGNCPSAINPAKPTILWLEQCETGLTAGSATSPCSGSQSDNGNLFVCSIIYSGSGGCSSEGADTQNTNRGHFEGHVATAYNTSTGVVTVTPPLVYPDWQSGLTPRAWIQQPIVDVGVENLAIDNSSNGTADTIQFFGAYLWWVSGVKVTNTNRWGIEQFQCLNGTVKDSYIYGATGNDADNMGVRLEGGSFNLYLNNIFTQVFGPVVFDGPSSGDVVAYNFAIDAKSPSDFLKGSFIEHSVDAFELYEGNAASSQWDDGEHGSQSMITRFRNFFTGWESCANGQCGSNTFKDSGTNALFDFYAGRYQNNIANILGTPGFHTSYQCTTSGNDTCVEVVGSPSAGVTPYDSLAQATLLSWGNWDSVTNAARWCGNSLDTGLVSICSSISEVPTTVSTYPNLVPTLGDTGAGQSIFPASFIYSSKPAWFGSIPWPAIGPDVSGGNIGQCSGTLNVSGKYNGVAATSSSQCAGSSLSTSWGGHVNANPAMNCFLNVMGGHPDGTGSVLAFDPVACYGSEVGVTGPAPPTALIATVN